MDISDESSIPVHYDHNTFPLLHSRCILCEKVNSAALCNSDKSTSRSRAREETDVLSQFRSINQFRNKTHYRLHKS